jgi:hypothetical protein
VVIKPEFSCSKCGIDFKSFYNSFAFFSKGLTAYNYPIPTLNPPFFLWVFQKLSQASLENAHLIWQFGALFLMCLHPVIIWKILSPRQRQTLSFAIVVSIYLVTYPVLVNGLNGQIWSLLSVLILLGYYHLKQNRALLPGMCWGAAAALKLSPILLLIYLLCAKNYKALFHTCLFLILFSAIPFLQGGSKVYLDYLSILSTVHWYQLNINSSLFGLVFYAFPVIDITKNLELYRFAYQLACSLSILAFISYVWLMTQLLRLQKRDTAFCLSLTFLVILSPISLLYSQSILLYPVLFLWHKVLSDKKAFYLWLTALLLIITPISQMATTWDLKFATNNLGLLLLAYLVYDSRRLKTQTLPELPSHLQIMLGSLLLMMLLYTQLISHLDLKL